MPEEQNEQTQPQAKVGTIANPFPLPQMTVKLIGADPRDAIQNNERTYLCRVYGEVTDIKTKEDRKGDAYSYLLGTFMAVRETATDAEFAEVGDAMFFYAEKLFLPGGIQEKVETVFNSNAKKPTQFGYDLYSVPDRAVSVGYRYAAASIMETSANNRMQVMTNEVSKRALPFVKTEEPKAPGSAPAPAPGKPEKKK